MSKQTILAAIVELENRTLAGAIAVLQVATELIVTRNYGVAVVPITSP